MNANNYILHIELSFHVKGETENYTHAFHAGTVCLENQVAAV